MPKKSDQDKSGQDKSDQDKSGQDKTKYGKIAGIEINYLVKSPDDAKLCHTVFTEVCDVVGMITPDSIRKEVELSFNPKNSDGVTIKWISGAPSENVGYSSKLPVFVSWRPTLYGREGDLLTLGKLTGKLASGEVFTILLTR